MSSFSASSTTASSFGQNIFMVKMPIEQVISTFETGFGCMHEQEVVCLAHKNTKAVLIHQSELSSWYYKANKTIK
jgi:hypothetical protein